VKRATLLIAAVFILGLASAPAQNGVFRDVTKASGVSVRIESDLRRLKLIATMIGGCAMGDYDGDGRPDLYVTNTVPRWGKPNPDRCGRLYRNVGGRFEDVTAAVDEWCLRTWMDQELEDRRALAKRDPKTLIPWGEKEKADFRKVSQGVWEKWSKKSPLAKEIYESQVKFLKSLGKL